ncbi:MAG: hypothetical protein Q7J68_00925 [Thermoplasmata archaeon]|nr:hypothetical protein [Thermoplasmata archaeon]
MPEGLWMPEKSIRPESAFYLQPDSKRWPVISNLEAMRLPVIKPAPSVTMAFMVSSRYIDVHIIDFALLD